MKISFSKLLLLFIFVPFIELFILLRIADMTSPLTAFALIIFTGVVGAYFAKQQGRKVVEAINRDIAAGQMPADSLVNGVCVLVGGIMLLTPGILTDILGFALVLPLTRPLLATWLKIKFSGMIGSGNVRVYRTDGFYQTPQNNEPLDDDDIVIINEDEEE
ncbi:MAG: hypothetical protein CSA13_01595 [Clostridiales bacterium]|nr:MAG: hypothetical protein CSA13_01595 [Clostridiales bacterium]